MFYAKQSLILFILLVIVWAINFILLLIQIIGGIISVALGVLVVVLWLMTWINALFGKMKDVFLIGTYAKKIDL